MVWLGRRQGERQHGGTVCVMDSNLRFSCRAVDLHDWDTFTRHLDKNKCHSTRSCLHAAAEQWGRAGCKTRLTSYNKKNLKFQKESCRFCTSRGSLFFFQCGLGFCSARSSSLRRTVSSRDIYSPHTPQLCYIKTSKFSQGRPQHPPPPHQKSPHLNISNRNVLDGD